VAQRTIRWVNFVAAAAIFPVTMGLPTAVAAQNAEQGESTTSTLNQETTASSSTTTTLPPDEADLDVRIDSETTVSKIETSTRQFYVLTITNVGPTTLPARQLTLVLKVPTGSEGQLASIEVDRFETGSGALIPSSAGAWCGRGTTTEVSCTNRQDLAPGQSITLEIGYRHPVAELGDFRMEVEATGTVVDPDADNNEFVGSRYQFASVPTTITMSTAVSDESSSTSAPTTTEPTTTVSMTTAPTTAEPATTAKQSTTEATSAVAGKVSVSTTALIPTGEESVPAGASRLGNEVESDVIGSDPSLSGGAEIALEGPESDAGNVPLWLYGIGAVLTISIVAVGGLAIGRSLSSTEPLVDLRRRPQHEDGPVYADNHEHIEESNRPGVYR